MKQSIAVAILLVLGFVAAVAAAVLVVFMRLPDMETVQQAAQPDPEVTVLVAASDLPARTVLDMDNVTETRVARTEAPSNHFTNVNDVAGRMLAVPVSEGQPLTSRLFPAPGSGYQLAGLLPSGMRAVSVSLPGSAGLDGLLYPGSVVDVLAGFRLTGQDALGTAVSTTLLENIQVLAVENMAVTSEEYGETDTATGSGGGSRGSLKVTLMVTSEQAEAVQLATEHGYVSLALRNPQDEEPIVRDATLLNQGQLARFAEVMEARRSASMLAALEAAQPEPEPEPEPEPTPAPAPSPPPRPSIEIDILRGTVTETKSFDDRR